MKQKTINSLLIIGFVTLTFGMVSCSKFKEEKTLVRNKIETIDKNTKIDLKVNFEEFKHYYDFTVEDSLQKALVFFIKNTEISDATLENYIELVDSITDFLSKEHSKLGKKYLKEKRVLDKNIEDNEGMVYLAGYIAGYDHSRIKREIEKAKTKAYKPLQKYLNKQSVISDKITQLDGLKSKLSNEYSDLFNKNNDDVLYKVYEVNYTWFSPELQTTKTKMTYYKIFEGTKEVVEDNNYIKPSYVQYAAITDSTNLTGEQKKEKMKNVSKNSEDWDAALISYESYIDHYVKLMKKAKNGDMSAMTEYVSMMEKANDLAQKMKNAGDDLSPAQMSKFVKLQTKLIDAAAEYV